MAVGTVKRMCHWPGTKPRLLSVKSVSEAPLFSTEAGLSDSVGQRVFKEFIWGPSSQRYKTFDENRPSLFHTESYLKGWSAELLEYSARWSSHDTSLIGHHSKINLKMNQSVFYSSKKTVPISFTLLGINPRFGQRGIRCVLKISLIYFDSCICTPCELDALSFRRHTPWYSLHI